MKKIFATMLCLALCAAIAIGCAAQSGAFSERTYAVEGARVQTIKVDVRDRKIEIEPSPDGQVRAIYKESDEEFYQIELNDGVLALTAATDKDWTDYFGAKPALKDRTIRLQIPDGTIANLEISTTNEDLSLPPLTVLESVSIDVNHGHIALERLNAGKEIKLAAKNGDIRGSIVGGYDDFDITSEARKGENNLPERKEGGAKTLIAFVNNGDIQIELQKD